jgi:hypothetical protein
LIKPMLARVVDYRRCCRDQVQMVGFRLARYIGEVVITERVPLSVGPIGGNVIALVLLLNAPAVSLGGEPRRVVVGGSDTGSAAAVNSIPLAPGKVPK